MKKLFINCIINSIGALVCFIIAAFHPFLSKIGGTIFIFKWWIWGIIGLVVFEAMYFYFFAFKHKK